MPQTGMVNITHRDSFVASVYGKLRQMRNKWGANNLGVKVSFATLSLLQGLIFISLGNQDLESG